MKHIRILFSLALLFVILFHPATVSAHHSWSNYHWSRTSTPLRVSLADNVSPQWDSYMLGAAYYWNRSPIIDIPVVKGTTSGSSCRAQSGLVQVCSASFGNTGWMGLAQLWVSNGHIYAATVKVNDTYFAKPQFNNHGWKNLVMCQEVGHAFGLDHQDEDFGNTPLGSCMDYSNNPNPNQWPNAHDYSQLQVIYGHSHSRTADDTTLAEGTSLAEDIDYNDPAQWGTQVSGVISVAGDSDRVASYERDFGAGNKVHTTVIHVAE